MDILMFLADMISYEIEDLLKERDYCNYIDRYNEIDNRIKYLESAENEIYDEIDEIKYFALDSTF